MKARASDRVLVLGDSGFGKSYHVKGLVNALGSEKPIIVWDPTCEWAGSSAERGLRGARVFHSVESLCTALRTQTLSRIVLQCGVTAEEEFAKLCSLVFAAGDCVFVVDEAHNHCRAGQCPKAMLAIVRMSRHRRIDLFVISQRPYTLAPDLRAQVNRTLLFHLSGESDTTWCDKERGRGMGERVYALKPREWIDYPSMKTNAKPTQRLTR